jgi:hypothetical protein
MRRLDRRDQPQRSSRAVIIGSAGVLAEEEHQRRTSVPASVSNRAFGARCRVGLRHHSSVPFVVMLPNPMFEFGPKCSALFD